jgi:glycosyltransferase involved in cell wall biosynthesis
MRMGQLCGHLRGAGHEVMYWTSCFSHARKTMVAADTLIQRADNFTIVWLRARGYKNHVSVARFRDHLSVAREFRRISADFATPDIIIASYPTIEMAYVATSYACRRGVPIVVDVRDMWPDLIHWSVPKALQALARVALRPYEWMATRALLRATALTSITDPFLAWSAAKAGRAVRPLDRVMHFCYEDTKYPAEELAAAERFWAVHNVIRGGRPVVLFIGSLNRSLDLRPLVEAARTLSAKNGQGPLFVLCGAGDMEEKYWEAAVGLENVIMPGWIDAVQIRSIMSLAAIAIAPLPRRADFLVTINNKFVEYLSGGLPILVSPPESEAARLVTEANCGSGFRLEDPASLAEQLTVVLGDAARLADWRDSARRLFDARFRADETLARWQRLIGEVAQSQTNNGTRR